MASPDSASASTRGPSGALARTPVRTSSRRLFADRAARWIVSAGGAAIILSVLGILVFILVEVIPLLGGASVRADAGGALPQADVGGLVVDEYRTHLVTIDAQGVVRAARLRDGVTVLERRILEDAAVIAGVASTPGGDLLSAATRDGRVALAPIRFETGYEEQERVVTPRLEEPVVLQIDPERGPLGIHAGRLDPETGSATAAAVLSDGSLSVVRRALRTNPLTEETSESITRGLARAPSGITALALDAEQRNLYAGTRDGSVVWWPLKDGTPGEPQAVSVASGAVTALALLLGDRSLVAGDADGGLGVLFPVRQEDDSFALQRVRGFRAQGGAIRWIVPSFRDKGFLAQSASGQLALFHSTSERELWNGRSPLPDAVAASCTPKGDAVYLAAGGRFASLTIDNPHPEVSPRALFGRVWYEGYRKPDFVWQSTGGTDDFEPKLSLTPLLAGTLKGTFFSLVLAIPLGVLSAMFASQFMHPDLKRFVKPAVEIMAALPSVVLGFLAGLWLAPRVERVFPGLLLMPPVLCGLLLLTRFGWHLVPRRVRRRLPAGSEVLAYLVVLAAGIEACLLASRSVEVSLFGGSFPAWLRQATGLAYDQRNAIVVGIAMGFAVIPIIFAIAEDAFSNVPRNLVSASLALGATRWQTVTRVVLPTASPGIFSAVMVGFGRAVGETMIVLMATGNTPIMDWSPFNGFRTLSANIAVEIAEAPHGGTLYRTLFLAALLLFVVTFLVNTAAEIVRQRLRRRYAQL